MICPKCKTEYPDGQHCQNASAGCLNYIYNNLRYPDEGGTFIDIIGFKYPYPGYPEKYALGQNATIKATIIGTIRLASKKPFRKLLFPLIFSKKKAIKELIGWLSRIYRVDFQKYQKDVGGVDGKRFCRVAREILRMGLWFANKIDDEDYRNQAIDVVWCICMIIEMDGAYRFRLIDVLSALNQSNLLENPRKEIARLMKIYLERENPGTPNRPESQIRKAILITSAVKYLLLLSPMFVMFAKDFLLALDLNEIKPTTADLYWMSRYYDYKFAGLDWQIRAAWRREEEKDWKPPILAEQKPETLANVDVRPNSMFYKLDEYNAKKLADNVKNVLLKDYKQKNEPKRP